jgi:chromosome segregation ATPase
MARAHEIVARLRQQQDVRDVSARVGNAIGQTQDTVLEAAAEMNNATRDVDELVAMMEIGSQRGLESIDALKEFAATWDTVGDATGESAPKLAQASVALNRLGIEAGKEQKAMGALSFVTKESTSSIDGFLQMVEQVGRELGDQAPHVNKMATLLEAMEEKGLRAQRAQREVREALRDSEGDMAAARKELGISIDEWRSYTEEVRAARGIIEQNAQAHAESRTTLQEWSSELESAMSRYSGLAQSIEAAGPALLGGALGIQGVTRGVKGLRTASRALYDNCFSPAGRGDSPA